MLLNELSHQPQVISRLREDIISERVSHAYLFIGSAASGVFRAAQGFAQLLHCRERRDKAMACGKCPGCLTVTGEYPGFAECLKPTDGIIKIDQVRLLLKNIYLKLPESGWKTFIIYCPERMTPEAANFLLKVLEEPPFYTVFLLVTHNLDGVLPTVVSRCRRVIFSESKFPDPVDIMEEEDMAGTIDRMSKYCRDLIVWRLTKEKLLVDDPSTLTGIQLSIIYLEEIYWQLHRARKWWLQRVNPRLIEDLLDEYREILSLEEGGKLG